MRSGHLTSVIFFLLLPLHFSNLENPVQLLNFAPQLGQKFPFATSGSNSTPQFGQVGLSSQPHSGVVFTSITTPRVGFPFLPPVIHFIFASTFLPSSITRATHSALSLEMYPICSPFSRSTATAFSPNLFSGSLFKTRNSPSRQCLIASCL